MREQGFYPPAGVSCLRHLSIGNHSSPFQQAAREQGLLGTVLREFQCPQGGRPCLLPLAQFQQQLPPDRVEEVVVLQVPLQGIDLRQRCLRPFDLPHCHRPVEPHHRRGHHEQQQVVKKHNLPPVGRGPG